MKKKLIIIFIFLFMFIPVNASTNTRQRQEDNLLIPDSINVTEENKQIILNTPSVDENEKIYDFADLYTSEEEEKLYYEASSFIESNSLDLVIVTINENNKTSAQNYADDFYDYNYFKEDGILFLVDMDTREIYISTNGDAIDLLTDYEINSILDSIYTYFSSEEYYDGTYSLIYKLNNYVNNSIVNLDDDNEIQKENLKSEFETFIISAIITSLIISTISIIVMVSKNKLVRKVNDANNYMNKEKVIINHVSDKFMGSYINKIKRSHNESSSGSSHGSMHHSSTHSSSSGRSHGGGGHKF